MWTLVGLRKINSKSGDWDFAADKIEDVYKWRIESSGIPTSNSKQWHITAGSKFNVTIYPIDEKRTDWKNVKAGDIIVSQLNQGKVLAYKTTKSFGYGTPVGPGFCYKSINDLNSAVVEAVLYAVPKHWFFFTPLSDSQSTEESGKCTCTHSFLIQGCTCGGK